MSTSQPIRILLVEDSPSDAALVRELFSGVPDLVFEIEQVQRLSDALSRLEQQAFDVVLLDLGLPDSDGVDTFARLHRQAPDVPILVLTSLEDEATGLKAIRSGAQDFIGKKHLQSALLKTSVRYSVIRAQVQLERDQAKQRDEQARELDGITRLATPADTTITARMYSASPLCETAAKEFKAAVAEYSDLLDVALEQRVFKTDNRSSERLRELGQQLGFLRAGPRDVVEIHTAALRTRIENVPAAKAQAYVEEGRIAALELMGYLTGYYRSYYSAAKTREAKP